MNIPRYKHLPPMLALGLSLAMLSACNKPVEGDTAPPAAGEMPDATVPAEEPATTPAPPSTMTMPAPPSTMTNNSYDDAQGTSNEAPASMPPPANSGDSSQDANKPNDNTAPTANPSSPPAGDDGNGG